MRKRFLFWGTCLALAMPALAGATGCEGLTPVMDLAVESVPRSITGDDLVRLRDIGPISTSDITAPILSISPEADRVAFQMRRADPQTNQYCLGIYVLDLRAGAKPVQVDAGGDLIRTNQSLLGVTNYPSGFTEVITPKWSPDGQWIAFLKRANDRIQVWRAKADGSHSEPISHVDFDVEAFAWTGNGRGVIISGRPGIADAVRALEEEGRHGFLYGDRYIPFAGNRPYPPDTIPVETFIVGIEATDVRPASGEEAARLAGHAATGAPASALRVAAGANGAIAWTASSDPVNVYAPTRLYARWPGHPDETCPDKRCGDTSVKVREMWWSPDGAELYFLREAWNRSNASLFRWSVRTGRVSRILDTQDALIGCQIARDTLVCAHESSRQPRRLVRIDLQTGTMSPLFDPNPEFKTIRLGTTRRLFWTNAFGIANFGDLVLPPDAQPGQKYPLVVVQYETRGFLRGGTDDEYPIFLFAAHNIAVLSFQHPDSVASKQGAPNWTEVDRLNRVDWTDRRNVQSSLEAGLKAAAASGQINTARMGVTGLSEGASMVQWAILNSHLFVAAASSSCCDDIVTTVSMTGPVGARNLYAAGYPRLTDENQTFWGPYSLLQNAARMNTPLLLQSADNEYLSGLESVTALQELDKPVEMYVFPGEYHQKWQPAHRQALYQRNLDWFDFWLRDVEDRDPRKKEQYARWRTMRAGVSRTTGGTPGP